MNNQDIMAKGQQYVMNTYGRFPIAPVKGQGTYLWDADGKQYLDFVGGIAVCALGHSPQILVEALNRQAHELWHTSNLYWIQPQVELAEKLVKTSGLDKVFFCNSGAEANEAAIKLARKHFYRRGIEKNEIIVFNNSFHGRTLTTVSATGQKKYQEGFKPLCPGFIHTDFNDLAAVKKTISEKTAAIMVEPIQGEGGINPADGQFLLDLRKLCDDNDILLIFDEVQVGMGRTGFLFAYQGYDMAPDIVSLAKGLGGGFPIGAMLANAKAASGFAPGDHASTFGGNFLATAVGNQVISVLSQPEFLQDVQKKGEYLTVALGKIEDSRIQRVRGKGLILGVDFDREVKELINICMAKGLLVLSAGPHILRLVPPLTVSMAEIDQALALLKEALAEWQD
ncbi:MAG: aspartate aminotransferase family protein [Syntrophomonadaceae bacterium]|nr:aspartate aminotransferase family protein [Syntrophomonadaceae bacterium]